MPRVDGIFTLRGKISGYGDIGGGGSNLTYQAVGVAGASLGERVAIVFGYRYLIVNYNKDRFVFDTHRQEPILGIALKL